MAKQDIYVDLDLNRNELRNAVFENLAESPETAKPGQLFYDSAASKFRGRIGEEWIDIIDRDQLEAVISLLPVPMQFKGTLGTGGTYTAQTLPAASSENQGWTLKVIEDGVYQGVSAEEGDALVSNGEDWILIPAGDDEVDNIVFELEDSGEELYNVTTDLTPSQVMDLYTTDTSQVFATAILNGGYLKSEQALFFDSLIIFTFHDYIPIIGGGSVDLVVFGYTDENTWVAKQEIIATPDMIESYIDPLIYKNRNIKNSNLLILNGAKEDSVREIKAFGDTIQQSTPTPSNPVDIVCNNGVIKARHESGLPLGYTLLDYIESSGTQYIDTGIVPTLDYEFEIKAKKTVNRSLIGSGSDDYVFTGGSGINYLYQGARQTSFPGTIDNTLVHTWAVKNGYLYCDSDSVAITSTPVTPTNSFALFARKTGSTTFDNIGTHTIYYAKIWDESDVLVFNGIPAKNSSNVIGMYDTVSGQFFTNLGTGDFVAGSVVSDPVEIYTEGTQETLQIKNIYNNVLSTATTEMLLKIGDYQDTQEIIGGRVNRNVGIKVLDGTEDWSQQGSSNNVYTLSDTPFPSDFASNPNNNVGLCTHFQVVALSTVISSNLIDGQMGWNQSGKIMFKHVASSADVTNWTNYLATQYANGTPVIIIYPLATTSVDTVISQPMYIDQDYNKLEISQSSLSDLSIEAEYKYKQTLPIPTPADNGKLLSVSVNGEYELVTIVNAENIQY